MTDVVQTTAPVRKSVTIRTSAERAFSVFTEGFDTWWPRSHHIGSSPITRAVIEGRVGGRWYSQQEDGANCPWGTVLVWEPPRRFVFAWQITPDWKYEPDLARSSEVELRFTPVGDGSTRVDLEHRHFERHGDGAEQMKTGVDGPQGWGALMQLFAQKAEER